MAKSKISFSDETINNLASAFDKWSKNKGKIDSAKDKGNSYDMAMYAEVISVVNGLDFNKHGNLKNEADRVALESEIGVALGNVEGAEAKGKRLREHSIKAVRHFNYVHNKGELAFPSQATPSAILEHLQSEAVNVSTESGLAALGKAKLDKIDSILKSIFGEIVTHNKMGKELEQAKVKGGLSADDLAEFQDRYAVKLAEMVAFHDRQAAEEAAQAKEIENAICNDALDVLEGKAA